MVLNTTGPDVFCLRLAAMAGGAVLVPSRYSRVKTNIKKTSIIEKERKEQQIKYLVPRWFICGSQRCRCTGVGVPSRTIS